MTLCGASQGEHGAVKKVLSIFFGMEVVEAASHLPVPVESVSRALRAALQKDFSAFSVLTILFAEVDKLAKLIHICSTSCRSNNRVKSKWYRMEYIN